MLIKIFPYMLVFNILFFFSIVNLYLHNNKKITLSILIVSFSILALFAGLRGQGVDPDNIVYQNIFQNIASGDLVTTNMEKGYLVLNKIIAWFSSDFSVFLLIFTSISLCFICLSFYLKSPIPIISLLLYFVHYYLARDFIAIRSSLAYALVLYGIIKLNDEKKIYKFIFIVSVACLFHKSAVLSFVLIPLFYIQNRFNAKKIISIMALLSVVFLFISPVNIVSTLFSNFLGVNSSIYMKYFESTNNFYDLGVFNPVNIKNLFLVLIIYSFLIDKYKEDTFIFLSFCLGSFLLIVFHEFGVVAARSMSQLVFIDTIIISMITNSVRSKYKLLILIAVSLYAFSMLYLNLSREGAYFYNQVLINIK